MLALLCLLGCTSTTKSPADISGAVERPPARPRGYLTTPKELLVIQGKAAQGLEPYQSAVAEVLAQAEQDWDFPLDTVASCPDADQPAWNDDRGGTPVLYAKALAFHLTEQTRYAEEVKTILEAIMTQVEQISTREHQCELNFGWGAPELVAAADLIEDYWNNLLCSGPTSSVPGERARGTGPCKRLFQNWLAQNSYYVVSLATTRMAGNNWGAAATNATLYIADYLWDRPTLQLRHRNPRQVNGGRDYLFTPAQAYAFLRHLTLERMRMHGVSWTAYGCDNLTTDQSPDRPPVKSGITEKGIVSEDARRQQYCNIPRYNGSYQNYPEIHLGNLIQQCELLLRRGDPACYDNVDWSDVPSYTYLGPDGDLKTTHLYPGRGSLERALDAILIDAGTEWRRPGALWVAYRYYRNHKRLTETDLSQWAPYLGSGAGKCYQDICFGTLTHGFAPEENPFLPPTVPPPQEEN